MEQESLLPETPDTLIERYSKGEMPIQEFAVRGTKMAAQRLDAIQMREKSVALQEAMFQEIRLDSEFAKRRTREQLAKGKEIHLNNAAHSEFGLSVRDRLGSSFYPPLVNEIAGDYVNKGQNVHFSYLKDNLNAALESISTETNNEEAQERMHDFKTWFYVEMYSLAAKGSVKDKVIAMMKEPSLRPPEIGTERKYWEAKWYGTGKPGFEGIRFMAAIHSSADTVSSGFAEKLYEEDSKRALNVLRAVLTIKTNTFSQTVRGMGIGQFREPVIKALAEGNIDAAEAMITGFIYTYPDVFTDATKDSFGISKGMIATFQADQVLLLEEESERRSKMLLQEHEARLAADQSKETIAKALGYKDQAFLVISTTKDAAGDIRHTPRIRTIHRVSRFNDKSVIETPIYDINGSTAKYMRIARPTPGFLLSKIEDPGNWFPLGKLDEADEKGSLALTPEIIAMIDEAMTKENNK